MATLKAELREILDRYGIDPRDKSQLWDCHGTLVLYHRAYEIIAAKEGIWFDPPTLIETRSADKIVAMLVVGHMGDARSEWSIGEAAPANCKNAYPYAMAEKRAKDRVIAKLAGLAAYVYSEAEADEFKDGLPVEPPGKPLDARPAAAPQRTAQPVSPLPAATSGPDVLNAIRTGQTPPPPNPEEPPEVTEARRAERAHFWTRESYAIDPAVIQGGMARWDAEMIAQAEAAPGIDAFNKLKQDNREAGFVSDWENTVATPVIKHFRGKMLEIEKRLSGAMQGAAA